MKNLRVRRKEKGYTCESLGKLINIQRSAVSKYERGEIQPSKETLVKLAHILDCTTDYLLGITNIPKIVNEKKSQNNWELSEEEEEYVKLIRLIPENRQEEYLQFLRSALKMNGLI